MSNKDIQKELLENYQRLVRELTADSPKKQKIKPLFDKCGLHFTDDPVAQMTTVLEGLNQVRSIKDKDIL